MRFFTYNGGHNYIIENQGQSVELTKDQLIELFKMMSPSVVGTKESFDHDAYDFASYMSHDEEDDAL